MAVAKPTEMRSRAFSEKKLPEREKTESALDLVKKATFPSISRRTLSPAMLLPTRIGSHDPTRPAVDESLLQA